MVLQANPAVPNHYYVQTLLHTQEKTSGKTPTPRYTSTRFSPWSIEREKLSDLHRNAMKIHHRD
jgi:hypothetical protein